MRMRLVFLLALSLLTSGAHAGIKQVCSDKRADAEAYANCVDVERKRAANALRDLDPQIMQTLHAHSKTSGNTRRMDAYRKTQVSHVRQRSRTCKQQNSIERAVCEGDMDNAQVKALQKYLKDE